MTIHFEISYYIDLALEDIENVLDPENTIPRKFDCLCDLNYHCGLIDGIINNPLEQLPAIGVYNSDEENLKVLKEALNKLKEGK